MTSNVSCTSLLPVGGNRAEAEAPNTDTSRGLFVNTAEATTLSALSADQGRRTRTHGAVYGS